MFKMNLNTKLIIVELEKQLNATGEEIKFQRKRIIGVMVEQVQCGNFDFINLLPLVRQIEERETFFNLIKGCLKEFKDIIAKEEYRPKNRIKGLI